MFVAVGLFNLVIAVLILLFLPNTPETTPWLSEAEKIHIRERLDLDQDGTGKKVFQKMALVEVLFDVHVWILFVLTILIDAIPSALKSPLGVQSKVHE